MGSVSNNSELTVVQWNARSLRGHEMHHKKAEFYDYLKTFKELPEVVCIQETWDKKSYQPIRLLGYKEPVSYRRNDNTKGGGVATFIKMGLDSEEIKYRQNNPNLEVSIVRIFGESKNIDIVNLYTNGANLITENDYDHIFSHVGNHHIIVGDFNVRDNLWDDQFTGNETPDARELNSFIEHRNLVVLNNGNGTRYNIETGNTTAIDLTLTSRNLSRNTHWYVHQNCLGSDHFPIVSKYNCFFKTVLQNPQPKWKISKANWTLFGSLTNNIDIDFGGCSIDECDAQFVEEIVNACNKSIPKTKPINNKSRHLPWWDSACMEAVKAKRRAYKLWTRHKTDHYKELYKTARANSKVVLDNAKKTKFREFISKLNHNTNSKEVWQIISKFNGKPFKPVEVIKQYNVRYHENKDKANVLANHYQKTSSNDLLQPEFKDKKREVEPAIDETVNESISTGNDEPYNALFTINELNTALNKKKSTAPGADTIHYDMLKNLTDTGKSQLLKLINKSWTEGKLPDQWKLGTIIPLLKPNKPVHEPGSYRPISLTSAVCKIMETMIANRLTSHIENNNLLAPTQSGFRKNRSTLDQIIRLQSAILKAKMENRALLCIFLDLEKAFDLMWTKGVLAQLVKFNIKGRILGWVQDFLKDRKIQVRVGSDLSDVRLLDNGSPQGSVLSPILFNILANTQYEVLKELFAELSQYADDSAVWKTAKSVKRLVQLLQRILNIIKEWAEALGIKISAGKTEVVLYNSNLRDDIPKLKIGNQELEYKTQGKFLGLTFDKGLHWVKHIDQLVLRCKKDLNLMRYLSGTKFGADKLTLMTIYKTLIRSKLDYGCQAYGSASKSQLARLDRIQSAALRIVTGAYRSTSITDLQVECCVPPLELRREELILKYWARSSANGPNLPLNDLYGHSIYETARHKLGGKIPFVMQVQDLKTKYHLEDIEVQEPVYAQTFALEGIDPRETLKPTINKKSDTIADIEGKVTNLISSSYHDHLHIFTDGSKDTDKRIVGCAFVIPELKITRSFKLGGDLSIFSAELVAIIEALKWVKENKPDKVVILTDSLSSIRALKSGNSNSRPDLILQVNTLVDAIVRENVILNMDWCPSHCNIVGNDLADEAAKTGSTHGRELNIKMSKTEAYSRIKRVIKDQWAKKWREHKHGLRWDLDNNLPTKLIQYSDERQLDRVYTRLRLGRNGLRFNNQTHSEMDPMCPHCDEIEDTDHYFLRCHMHIDHRIVMFNSIKDNISDIGEITVKTLLNPSHAHSEIIRGAVFQYIKDTEYMSRI